MSEPGEVARQIGPCLCISAPLCPDRRGRIRRTRRGCSQLAGSEETGKALWIEVTNRPNMYPRSCAHTTSASIPWYIPKLNFATRSLHSRRIALRGNRVQLPFGGRPSRQAAPFLRCALEEGAPPVLVDRGEPRSVSSDLEVEGHVNERTDLVHGLADDVSGRDPRPRVGERATTSQRLRPGSKDGRPPASLPAGRRGSRPRCARCRSRPGW